MVNPAVFTDVVQSHALSTYPYLNVLKCVSVPVAANESDQTGPASISSEILIAGGVLSNVK